jgi:hypothetical protein
MQKWLDGWHLDHFHLWCEGYQPWYWKGRSWALVWGLQVSFNIVHYSSN